MDTVSYDRMMWRRFRDRRVLGDHACWVGDEVGVVVAAESEAVAEEALRLIEVDWEVLPFVLDVEAAMKPGAPVVHPEIAPDNVLPADPVGGPRRVRRQGRRLDAAWPPPRWWSRAPRSTTTPPRELARPLVLRGRVEGRRLTVWSNSYEADQSRMHISQMLDLPLHRCG